MYLDKKGSVVDLITISMIILIVAFIIITSVYIFDKIDEQITSLLPSANVQNVIDKTSGALGLFDIMFGFFQIGLVLFLVISAFYLDTNPAYFFIAIFFLIISIIISAQFSNMFAKFIGTSDINSTTAINFPVLTWIMDNQPLIVLVAGILFLIFLYAKSRGIET